VWQHGGWQESSRREGVEQALDVRLGVQIPASQLFILWQLLEFLKISTDTDSAAR
jgi:hypothetical protein